MDDILTKVLLLILGFLLGTTSNILVSIVKEARRRSAVLDLIRTEIETFIDACENAAKRKLWGSTTVEKLSSHIARSYSEDRDRFVSIKGSEKRKNLCNFYIEASSLIDLIQLHRKQEKFETNGSTGAIGPGTYEGIVERSRKLLNQLK